MFDILHGDGVARCRFLTMKDARRHIFASFRFRSVRCKVADCDTRDIDVRRLVLAMVVKHVYGNAVLDVVQHHVLPNDATDVSSCGSSVRFDLCSCFCLVEGAIPEGYVFQLIVGTHGSD